MLAVQAHQHQGVVQLVQTLFLVPSHQMAAVVVVEGQATTTLLLVLRVVRVVVGRMPKPNQQQETQ